MYFTDTFTVLQRSTTGVKRSILFLCILPHQSSTEGCRSPREGAPVPDMGNAVPERGMPVPEGGILVLQHSWGTGIDFKLYSPSKYLILLLMIHNIG